MKWLKNRTALGVSCILFSLILCLIIAPLLNRSANEKITIVRMVQNVAKGEVIAASQVDSINVAAFNLPADALKSIDHVVGQYATVDLKVGDYVFPSKLSQQTLLSSFVFMGCIKKIRIMR